MNRSIAALAATAGLLVFAAPALAGEALPTTSTPTTSTPTTSTPTTSTPVTTTTTEVPVTTTSVPTTTSSVPTTTTTDPITDACVVDCIPAAEDACSGANCVPIGGAGGVPATYGAGRGLPFTGIEDMVLPLLLGLVVLLGGVVAWRWAQLREAVAEAAMRARRLPAQDVRTAYQDATRQLHIEHRARQVFMPRVA